MGRGALAMEAAAAGGISPRALAPTEEQTSAFLYPAPRARAAGPARAPERRQIPSPPAGAGTFSTYRHHACNPSARLTALSRRSNRAKSAAQPQENVHP